MKQCNTIQQRIFTQCVWDNLKEVCEIEYRFCKGRKWRFDYAIPKYKIAIEQDGGLWTGGRHIRPAGYIKDMEKFNNAAMLGWVVLKFSPDELLKTNTMIIIRNTLNNRKLTQ